ncbi:UNVERIFIED_CONTAM: hypothetical protein Slati_1354400 [Sesamum latifolium]|uniref:Uncharacterized protein n=1 Tax=Sesamum latifolium TaxID=2727402 RepID=A0AAW2XIC5_9LAMI
METPLRDLQHPRSWAGGGSSSKVYSATAPLFIWPGASLTSASARRRSRSSSEEISKSGSKEAQIDEKPGQSYQNLPDS